MKPTRDVIVVGGGIIGLAVAWRAAQRGLTVTVVDPEPGAGASFVAAGMIAPVTEAHFGEEALLRLNLASAGRWPDFAAELEAASGLTIDYRPTGTLEVAFDADDNANLEHTYRYLCELGLGVSRLRARDVRALEPAVAPNVRGGIFVDGDHQVDPRLVCAALVDACERAGVALQRERVEALDVDRDRVTGVRAGGDHHAAGVVVLAAGCWSALVPGLPASARPPVRPVKGQIMILRGNPAEPLLRHAVRGRVQGATGYLVPRGIALRGDGRIVVGATVEEQGFDTTVTAWAVYELLRDASLLVPGLRELAFDEVRAGLRPGTPDNAPLIGPGAIDGLAVATGHFRNGVLLAPVTADATASLLADGHVEPVAAPFSPRRFEAVGADR